MIHQEIDRLPDRYRRPVVLCYLEGQTHEEAARQLKWPIGTVKGRLSRARELLRSRLLRRGLTPSVAALALAFSRESSAALSPAGSPDSQAHVLVNTSVEGFGAAWKNVLDRFFARFQGAASIEINDFGATPGTVMLRLEQAAEATRT